LEILLILLLDTDAEAGTGAGATKAWEDGNIPAAVAAREMDARLR